MSNPLVEALKEIQNDMSGNEYILKGIATQALALHDQSGIEEVKAIDVIKRAYKETEKLDFSEHMMDDQLDKAFLIANEVQDILGIYLEGEHKLWKEEYATPHPEGERDYTKGGSGEETLKFAEWFADHIEGRYSETLWCDIHGRDFTVAEMYKSFKERPDEDPQLTYPFKSAPSKEQERANELEGCLRELLVWDKKWPDTVKTQAESELTEIITKAKSLLNTQS